MSKSKVEFIKPEAFTINLPSVGAPVTVRTESDEIVIVMRLTLRPRDNMMKIDLDISAGGDGASMTRLDQDAPSDPSRYWTTTLPE
jgi:hypothetical protein